MFSRSSAPSYGYGANDVKHHSQMFPLISHGLSAPHASPCGKHPTTTGRPTADKTELHDFESKLLPHENSKPDSPRAACSHSASVGRRMTDPIRAPSQAQN